MSESLAAEITKCNVQDERIVSFQDRKIKLDNAQAAEEIIRAIETCPNMEIFNLVGNTLGVEAAQEIANGLRSRPTLKFAILRDMYTGRLRSEIPPSLRALSSAMITAGTQLVELDLSDNAFGPDGAEAIRGLLTSPVAYTIQSLKFQNNGLGAGGVVIAECLTQNHARALKAGKSLDLRSFIAGRNRLENPGAIALGKAFSLLGTLEQIEVIQNGIQFEGIAGIAECIKHSPNLRILNLNDNIMTPRGAIAIAKALPNAKKLEVLNIGDCLVKSEGAHAIAENIKELKSLKELILSYNEIREDGGVAIAKACTGLSSLKELDLDGNHFGDEGKKKVGDALGASLSLLQPGLNNDEGIPSDDEGDNPEEEEKEVPEKPTAPFVFGAPAPALVGTTEPNRPFGFGASSTFSFSGLSSGTTNIFTQNSGNADHSFKGAGTALFSAPSAEGGDAENPEQEANVQFEPLVHLDKVEVKSGEENDLELYKHRAKIFRFDRDVGAWKERGVGDMRILQDKTTKKARLIMRRDIIFKICCNHMITKQMEMQPNAGSDKSLVWFTHADFSEDEARPEQLAIRFKTPDICKDFLATFNRARDEIPEPGSTPKKETPADPPAAKNEPFSFASLAATSEKAAFAAQSSPQASPSKISGEHRADQDSYEPDVHFEPQVHVNKIDHVTGTEGEETRFAERSKLYRFDKATNQWKERGLGEMSVLWNKRTGKGRVLMRREQILKLCCNHLITAEMELKPHQGNDKFLVWHTFADFSETEEDPKFEQLAAKFKTAEIAGKFRAAFEKCQADLGKVDESEDPVAKAAEEALEKVAIAPAPAASPAAVPSFIARQKEKWTCGTCSLMNEKSANACIACTAPNPNAPPQASQDAPNNESAPKFTFGLPAATPTFTFGAAPAPAAAPLSFGSPAAPAAAPLSFGSPAAAPAAAPGFSFGAPAPGFSFGPPSAGFSFGSTPATTQSPAKEETKPSPFAGFSFGSPGVQSVGTPTVSAPTLDYKKFVAEPSSETLEQITSPDSVIGALECESPARVAEFLGKLSRVMDNKTTDTAHQIMDAVLTSSFAKSEFSASVVTNELLVTMGLIKSEDKDYKPLTEVENMLRLLSHAVSQPYFPPTSAKIVSAFVSKDREVLSNKINDCTELLNSFQI